MRAKAEDSQIPVGLVKRILTAAQLDIVVDDGELLT